MAEINWVQVGVSWLAGGAFGALMKIGYDLWSDRHQPVLYRVCVDSIFSSSRHPGALQAEAQVTHDGKKYAFDDLALVRVELRNKGNRDLDSFDFGITLGDGHAAVLTVNEGEDRHHVISEQAPIATPALARDALDFRCAPFNRRDQYTVRLYVRNTTELKSEDVKPSTSAPVRFARTKSFDEGINFNSPIYWFSLIGFVFLLSSLITASASVFSSQRFESEMQEWKDSKGWDNPTIVTTPEEMRAWVKKKADESKADGIDVDSKKAK